MVRLRDKFKFICHKYKSGMKPGASFGITFDTENRLDMGFLCGLYTGMTLILVQRICIYVEKVRRYLSGLNESKTFYVRQLWENMLGACSKINS